MVSKPSLSLKEPRETSVPRGSSGWECTFDLKEAVGVLERMAAVSVRDRRLIVFFS